MSNKQIIHSFDGMSQDTTQSKFSNKFYFEGKNIRILATDSQSTGSITNEKGNSLIFKIPSPIINNSLKNITYLGKTLPYTNDEISLLPQSGEQLILGNSATRDGVILFTTDNNGFDCIWRMDYNTYDLILLYVRNMEFSINYPIQVLNNFENKSIDKVYWVDGKSQIKFINLNHSLINNDLEELIDLPVKSIQLVSDFDLSSPVITDIIKGGRHTSGMIQYAYNLYRLNSSQSKISPLSKLIPLDKLDDGGGDLNELVVSTPIILIDDLDVNYTHIKVYAIKYTSYNEIPSISLIYDREIPSNKSVEILDNGSIINTLSLEEFLFLGSDIILPKHISSKFNRLFISNYKELNFNVDIDCRSYSYDNLGSSKIYTDLFLNTSSPTPYPDGVSFTITNDLDYDNILLKKHDSVNLDYNVYKYQKNGSVLGGEGKYLKYELTQDLTNDNNKFFKDEEIYRIGIQFYNSYGQISSPNWIADFKSRSGNLKGLYNTLKITLKPEFYIWLNNGNLTSPYDIPVGYKILVAERTSKDRTIVASGMIGGMMIDDNSAVQVGQDVFSLGINLPKIPNFLIRNSNNTTIYGKTCPLRLNYHLFPMNTSAYPDTEVQLAHYFDKDTAGRLFQFNAMMQMYSPEILFKDTLVLNAGLTLKLKGAFKNTFNSAWGKTYNTSTLIPEYESIAFDGVSPFFSNSSVGDLNTFSKGLISQAPSQDSNTVNHILFNREYGKKQTFSSGVDSNKTIRFTIPPTHTLLSNNDNSKPTILLNNNNKSFSVLLDAVYSKSTISYEIVPDVGYTSTQYSLKICSDVLASNVLTNLNFVTGTQTITTSDTFTSTPGNLSETFSYFLAIESLLNFKGVVNITISAGTLITPIQLQKESLLNIFDINNPVVVLNGDFIDAPIRVESEIYGTPELTTNGQGFKSYNDDPNYRYTNSLKSVLTDGDSSWAEDGVYGRKIVSINSNGNRCVTMVLGDQDPFNFHTTRPKIESLFLNSGLGGDDNGLICELIKPITEIYLGSIYGGNSYEDKKRTTYYEVGELKKIIKTDTSSINYVISPGDTFVQNFKFERIVRTEEPIFFEGNFQMCEIVSYLTETTINLKNRNDLSLQSWNAKFQPGNDEFHKYNKVYSQSSNLIKNSNLGYNIKKINNFNTNVITTKLKSSGELIDSWTDILPNETLTLDGKYGSINALVNFNDELYTIQDKAFAFLSISPRVQVQGSDGVAVQLGKGSILDRYKYLSTEAGTINKWSVVSSPIGLYFYDTLNKSFNVFKDNVLDLSDLKNMHSYFTTNTNEVVLIQDNPFLKTGISSGYDYINNDVFMTFHQDEKSYTISYNERVGSFISLYDYKPSMYISKGSHFITTSPDNKKLYRQYYGEYNKFYDVYYPSSFTLNINPESDKDCIFDNINFKSEVTLNNVDQVDKTLTGIRAYNDYQDSNSLTTLTPLVVGRNNNLRRKFRDWNALIPRDGRNRIRAPYIKLKLEFNNTSNYKLIMHDLAVYYTTS
jgi:hypothetical protein